MRWLWFAAGWLMVALGFIGAMLPVMPTTIFLIMAVGCFARSSPRFERWLLALGVGLFFVLGAAYVGTRPLPRQEREPGDAGPRIGR